MDRKKFGIWRNWKAKQQAIELLELQENLASRGLASSSTRNSAENHLKEKYEAEVEMEQATMESEEAEARGRAHERKNLIRTNWIIAIGTISSVILTLPIFSAQINNIQVKVDSLEASIHGIYASYTLETFCYDDLKDSFTKTDLGNTVEIKLKKKPVINSINVWEGAVSVSPTYFRVNGDILEVSTNMDPKSLKEACSSMDFKYSVTYIPEQP